MYNGNEAGAIAHGYQLAVGDPDRAAVLVAQQPQHSVIAHLRQLALPAPARTADPRVLARISVRPTAHFALRPFRNPGPWAFPDCCTPIPGFRDATVTEQIDCIRQRSADDTLADLHHLFGAEVPATWQPVLSQPERWLRSFADASRDVWRGLTPQWTAVSRSFDREVTRAGVAAVRGAVGPLLNSLHPRLHYREGTLTFDCPTGHRYELGDRRLLLIPMLGTTPTIMVHFDLPDYVYVAYPMRVSTPARSGRTHSELALILGAMRAATLEVLQSATTMGRLASALNCTATTASYHCAQLEAAGLVCRERVGRSVRIARTSRGDQLMDLLAH